MRLVPPASGRIVAGSVRFDGMELLTLEPAAMRAIRGNRIGMIFQEPMTSLNPVLTIGRQIAESVALHQQLPRSAAFDRAVEMLTLVKIPAPRRRAPRASGSPATLCAALLGLALPQGNDAVDLPSF